MNFNDLNYISWKIIECNINRPLDVKTKQLSLSEAQAIACKNMFLKLLQNSQENTCIGILFWKKLQVWPATLSKQRLQQGCFLVNFAKFLRKPYRALPVAGSNANMERHRKPISEELFLNLNISGKPYSNELIFRYT